MHLLQVHTITKKNGKTLKPLTLEPIVRTLVTIPAL
jgi:hypothetical protein